MPMMLKTWSRIRVRTQVTVNQPRPYLCYGMPIVSASIMPKKQ